MRNQSLALNGSRPIPHFHFVPCLTRLIAGLDQILARRLASQSDKVQSLFVFPLVGNKDREIWRFQYLPLCLAARQSLTVGLGMSFVYRNTVPSYYHLLRRPSRFYQRVSLVVGISSQRSIQPGSIVVLSHKLWPPWMGYRRLYSDSKLRSHNYSFGI